VIGTALPSALIYLLHLFKTKSGAPLVKAKNFPFYFDTVVIHLVSEENGKIFTTCSLFLSYL